MNVENYIYENIFSEKEKYRVFYELIWTDFFDCGFVITDIDGHEIDSVIKAIAMENLVGEFTYRLYDSVNEIGYDNILIHLGNLGFGEDDIMEYCKSHDCDDDDFEMAVKATLDNISEEVADKMLEEFSADDIFDYMFTATYDFEQDFTFEFEDVDEFQAFVDSNTERLDSYKEEYPSVMTWIESGMIC